MEVQNQKSFRKSDEKQKFDLKLKIEKNVEFHKCFSLPHLKYMGAIFRPV